MWLSSKGGEGCWSLIPMIVILSYAHGFSVSNIMWTGQLIIIKHAWWLMSFLNNMVLITRKPYPRWFILILVHLLISIAINQGQPLHQLDVSNVFFYGDLTEGMFTKKPLSLYSSWGDCQDMPPSSCYLQPDANPACITKSSKFSHTT